MFLSIFYFNSYIIKFNFIVVNILLHLFLKQNKCVIFYVIIIDTRPIFYFKQHCVSQLFKSVLHNIVHIVLKHFPFTNGISRLVVQFLFLFEIFKIIIYHVTIKICINFFFFEHNLLLLSVRTCKYCDYVGSV